MHILSYLFMYVFGTIFKGAINEIAQPSYVYGCIHNNMSHPMRNQC
jgi:hypothetical protein